MSNFYYFTFGSNHLDDDGNSLRQCFVKVEGKDCHEARAKMVEARGDKWAFYYESAGRAGVERFGLQERSLEGVTLPKEGGVMMQALVFRLEKDLAATRRELVKVKKELAETKEQLEKVRELCVQLGKGN